MKSEIITRRAPRSGLTVYSTALAPIEPVFRFATTLVDRTQEFDSLFAHSAGMASHLRERRDRLLPLFMRAEAASSILLDAYSEKLDRKTASAMVGALLAGFGAKPDPDVLAAMLDALEGGEELAGMTGMIEGADQQLWRPTRVSPASLALACKGLVATATFPPRAAELLAACRKTDMRLMWAQEACEKLVDYVRRCDAVLLEFDLAGWARPYAENRPVLERMLRLHDIYGDGSDTFDDGEPNAFRDALEREKAKLVALPAPEPEPVTLREAACKSAPAKRTTRKRKRKA
jgi:hypothetical protein